MTTSRPKPAAQQRRSHHGATSWLVALLLALLGIIPRATSQSPDASAERGLFELTNRIRNDHHLAPLVWDPALAARRHALRLAAEPGPLEHQYPGEPDLLTRAAQARASFHAVSENLARGHSSPNAIEQLWMSTPIHRANLLDPQLDSIGIAVLNRDGVLFAVQDFSHSALHDTRADIEARVQQLLYEQGLAAVTISQLARTTCEQHRTSAPGALLLVQWDGDTTALPTILLEQLRHTTYRSASIGACPSINPDRTFASARVTVLLF